jgi:predicted dehydrogenase
MACKVLVVGTGSIGSRHIANLLTLGVDVLTYSYRREPRPEQWFRDVRAFERLEDAFAAAPDAVVVANRTDQHLDVALRGAREGRALFIEKPLSHSLAGIDELARECDSRALVVESGFMLRLHPNVTWLKSFLDAGELGDLFYCRALAGQHLPDWRPAQDHRASYSASAVCGGVIFDLAHELDLVAWLFGPVDAVQAMTARVPSLQIQSEAIAQIGLRTAGGLLAQVHMDYVRPVYGRTLEVAGSRGVMTWDYVEGTVSLTTPAGGARVVHRVPASFVRNDLFAAHMRHFLARLTDVSLAPVSSLNDGVAALRTALACRQSAGEGRLVRPADVSASLPMAASVS